MKRLSIQDRMLIIALLPALIVAILVTASIVINRISEIESEGLQNAKILAMGLAHTSEFAIASDNNALLQSVSQPVLNEPTIAEIKFTSPAGITINQLHAENAKNYPIGSIGMALRPWIQAQPLISEITVPIIRTDLSAYEDPYFHAEAVPFDTDNNLIGYLTLTVNLSSAYQHQLQTIKKGLTIALLAMLVTIPAAILLANSVTRPVRAVTNNVGLLANNKYAEITHTDASGELGELERGVEHLSTELQSFHKKLRRSTELATEELQSTLEKLESQNKQLEQARKEAEIASAFKSDFLANMSHEIRSPMNTIVGTMSLLNHSSMTEEQREHVKVIHQSSNTLLSLIDEILDISRIESGELKLDARETDLQQLLSEVNFIVTGLAVDKGISLFIGSTTPPDNRLIIVDSLRLKQIMVNLLINAIKFTDTGHVALNIDCKPIDAHHCKLQFSVVDTGIGIPESKFKNIFLAFTQIDMSTTRSHGGSGLGLHICREIIDLMDGTIELSSEVGEGSTFTVTAVLPLGSKISATRVNTDLELYYVDYYEPLKSHHETLLKAAGFRLVNNSDTLLLNIPNTLLPSGNLAGLLPTNHDQFKRKIALVSQTSSSVRIRLNALQFDGYVVRTPSLPDLQASFNATVGGTLFDSPADHRELPTKINLNRDHCKVLAIDDQKINIQLLTRYFEHLNITASYAHSAAEGIQIASEQAFDLIMVDLHMPELDGFYVAQEIRTRCHYNAETPLIAVTADAYKSTREKAIDNGFDDLITKPVTIDHVTTLFNEWTTPNSQASNPVESTFQSHNNVIVPEPLVSLEACTRAMLGDQKAALRTLALYKKELEQYLDAISPAATPTDTKVLYFTAHSLKGSSALCGIEKITDMAKSLEDHCISKNWQAIKRTTLKLNQLVTRAITECDQILIEHDRVEHQRDHTRNTDEVT